MVDTVAARAGDATFKRAQLIDQFAVIQKCDTARVDCCEQVYVKVALGLGALFVTDAEPAELAVHDAPVRFGHRPPNLATAAAVMAAAFAAIAMPSYGRRFSADWWKDNERRAAAQRVEQERIADYYARTTKEQEDRENAEARERFLEQQRRLTVNRPPRPPQSG
jgi:hypothetical protein